MHTETFDVCCFRLQELLSYRHPHVQNQRLQVNSPVVVVFTRVVVVFTPVVVVLTPVVVVFTPVVVVFTGEL